MKIAFTSSSITPSTFCRNLKNRQSYLGSNTNQQIQQSPAQTTQTNHNPIKGFNSGYNIAFGMAKVSLADLDGLINMTPFERGDYKPIQVDKPNKIRPRDNVLKAYQQLAQDDTAPEDFKREVTTNQYLHSVFLNESISTENNGIQTEYLKAFLAACPTDQDRMNMLLNKYNFHPLGARHSCSYDPIIESLKPNQMQLVIDTVPQLSSKLYYYAINGNISRFSNAQLEAVFEKTGIQTKDILKVAQKAFSSEGVYLDDMVLDKINQNRYDENKNPSGFTDSQIIDSVFFSANDKGQFIASAYPNRYQHALNVLGFSESDIYKKANNNRITTESFYFNTIVLGKYDKLDEDSKKEICKKSTFNAVLEAYYNHHYRFLSSDALGRAYGAFMEDMIRYADNQDARINELISDSNLEFLFSDAPFSPDGFKDESIKRKIYDKLSLKFIMGKDIYKGYNYKHIANKLRYSEGAIDSFQHYVALDKYFHSTTLFVELNNKKDAQLLYRLLTTETIGRPSEFAKHFRHTSLYKARAGEHIFKFMNNDAINEKQAQNIASLFRNELIAYRNSFN